MSSKERANKMKSERKEMLFWERNLIQNMFPIALEKIIQDGKAEYITILQAISISMFQKGNTLKNIGSSWKNILEENLPIKKLSIILTETKKIIKLKIFSYLILKKNTLNFIKKNYSKHCTYSELASRTPKKRVARYGILIPFLLAFSSCNPLAIASEMDLSSAVIHHTASGDVSVKTIDQWHKERGWDGIGYHYIIRTDGTIEEGRSIEKKGAHAKGRNHFIGIALCGYDEFTEKQISSLKSLLKKLEVKHIERHHENCPGKGLDSEWDHLLQGGQDAKSSQTRSQGEKT